MWRKLPIILTLFAILATSAAAEDTTYEKPEDDPAFVGPRRPVVKDNDFWLTLDVGVGLWEGFYPSLGLTMPLPFVKGLTLSVGVWGGTDVCNPCREDNFHFGPYVALGYSWTLIE